MIANGRFASCVNLAGAGVGCGTPKTVNVGKFCNKYPAGMYPLCNSYESFRICEHVYVRFKFLL